MKQHSSVFYIFLIVIQGLLFGVGNALIRFAYVSLTPLWCMVIRFLLATLLFAAFFGPNTRRELRLVSVKLWLPSALGMAVAYATCNVALAYADVTNVGFLISLAIVFTPFLAKFAFGRPLRRGFLPVPLLSLVGLYLISYTGAGFRFGFGDLLALSSSFAMAVALVWGKECLETLSPGTVSFLQAAVTTVFCLVTAVIFEPFPDLTAVTPTAWLVVAYVVIFCSLICYSLQNIALTRLSAAVVSLTQCSEPLFTAAAAFILLGERLSPAGLIGATLLFLTIVYGNFIAANSDKKEMTS